MSRAQRWALAGVLLLFGVCAVWAMKTDLPFSRFATEEEQIFYAVKFGTGDLNPHYFLHPPFFAYVLFLVYGAAFVIGRLFGAFGSVADFQRLFFTDPTLFFLMGRLVVLILAVGGLGLFFRFSLRVYRRADVALLATAFLGASTLHAAAAHYANTDIPMMVLALLAWGAILQVLREGTMGAYVAAGLLIGLATATKYNAAWLAIGLGLAHMLRTWRAAVPWPQRLGWPRLMIGAGLVVVGFVIGCPFAALDYPTFIASYRKLTWELMTPQYHFAAYRVQGASYLFLLGHVLPSAIGWPLVLVSVLGVGAALRRRQPEDWLLALFLISFVGYVGHWDIIKPRYFIFAVPLMLLLGARWCVDLIERVSPHRRAVVLTALWAVLALHPLWMTVQFNRLLSQTPVGLQARTWMAAHVPSGTAVATFVGVPLAPNAASLQRQLAETRAKRLGQGMRLQQQLRYLADQPAVYDIHPLPFPWREDFDPQDFDFTRQRQAGVRYVIITDEIENYLADPQRYPVQVDYYHAVLRHGRLVQQFRQPRPQVDPGLGLDEYIKIYEVANG